jgi:predicted metallopeptidase
MSTKHIVMKKKIDYTVIGIFGDNQQPWMEHVKALTPKAAALAGIKKIDKRNDGGVEVEDLFVIEVIRGHVKGCLCNEKVVNKNSLSEAEGKSVEDSGDEITYQS